MLQIMQGKQESQIEKNQSKKLPVSENDKAKYSKINSTARKALEEDSQYKD